MTRFRVEVADEHGTVAVIIDPPQVPPASACQLAALAADAVTSLAVRPGVASRAHAREILIAALVRLVADEEAYERVAKQRGLLPL